MLAALLELLRGLYGPRDIYLSLYANNQAALSLYRKFGFVFNGETDVNGEQVMVLRADNNRR